MCRLLGVVSGASRPFDLLLEQAPHSLAVLSREHGDGWGVAVSHGSRRWKIRRGLLRAGGDAAFREIAGSMRGTVLVAHVRQRTRGPIALENTHPFECGRWVFAHNGTVQDLRVLEDGISSKRRSCTRGETDSERLFAFLLSHVDRAAGNVDGALRAATRAMTSRPQFGTASFLLSNGTTLYAHRLGAPLHLLQRRAIDVATCEECGHSPCIAVATEPVTDEAWIALADGDLVRIDRDPAPHWRRL